VVQPVAMPAEWETGSTAAPAVGPMLKLSRATGAPVPVRASGGMRAVTAQASGGGQTFGRQMMEQLLGRAPREDPATPAQREAVRQALEAFLRAFSAAKSGTGKDGDRARELEQARIALLRALGASLAIATAVPLLQAFLRGAAVELVASLSAGAADATILERHARALEAARNEARPVLGDAGGGAGNFWEASI
jgi:hypothetical protein